MVDYEKAIKKILEVYGDRGHCFLWEKVNYFKKELGSFRYGIVKKIGEEYFKECASSSSSRLFGIFPEEDVLALISKCKDLESKFIIKN